jgi:hypothetical protein
LSFDISRQKRTLGWVVPYPLNAQQILKFNLGLGQIGEQFRCGSGTVIVAVELAETRCQIDMNRLIAKQRVDGSPIGLGELLEFVDPYTSLALLNRDDRGARDTDYLRCCGLSQIRRLTRSTKALTDFCRRNLRESGHDCTLPAH